MSRQRRLLAALVVLAAGLGYLGYQGLTTATSYYYTVEEYLALPQKQRGNFAQVKGTVVPESLRWEPDGATIHFTLAEGGREMNVSYAGVKPDLLQGGIEAVVAGRLAGENFLAEQVIVKCPSKYEAAPEAAGGGGGADWEPAAGAASPGPNGSQAGG